MAEDLLDYQFKYRDLLFGADTEFGLTAIEGIDELNIRSGSKEFPRGHGSIPGKHFAQALPLAFAVVVDPINDLNAFEDVENKLRNLKKVFTVYEDFNADVDKIVYKLPGQPVLMKYVRPITLPISRGTPANHLAFRMVFENADPRTYSADPYVSTIPIYNPTGGGTEYPKDYTYEYIGGGTGEITVRNDGNTDAYPIVNFYGPSSGSATGVRLDNITNGDYIDVQTSIAAGQILTADMEAVVVAINRLPIHMAGASRYGNWQLPRKPLRLSPGDNSLRFSATGDSTNMQAVVTWRDTWL